MKPTQARIANLWRRLMHTAPMWPSHGRYECRRCGQRHRVCWEQPQPADLREMAMPFEAHALSALGNSNGIDPSFGSSGHGRS